MEPFCIEFLRCWTYITHTTHHTPHIAQHIHHTPHTPHTPLTPHNTHHKHHTHHTPHTTTFWQDLQGSDKIRQDQTKPIKGSAGLTTPVTKCIVNHIVWGSKIRGWRCHAAWRLQSAPGPWAPEACLIRVESSLP